MRAKLGSRTLMINCLLLEREMAGLLAWAADVVGGGAQGGEEEETSFSAAVVFTPEQQKYARELEQRASSLRRSIQDLRLRIPPPDISQRLPHLHAHSLASNAALALQLNSHSTTRQQVQLREVTLQEENAAYEKAVSNCQKKIQEKLQEMDLLQHKLKEMDLTEKSLRAELEKTEASSDASQSTNFGDDSKFAKEALADRELPKHAILEDLDKKKRELSSVEAMVKNLENTWAQIQLKSVKEPSPAQREKILEKQLQSLIEQLESKQGQAEHLVTEIHVKEKELEKLNDLWRIENGNVEVNAARNRFGRSSSSLGSTSTDYIIDPQIRPSTGGRIENQQKMMLMRFEKTPIMGPQLEKLLEILKSRLLKIKKPYKKIDKSESMRIEISSRKAQKMIAETLKVADSLGNKSYVF